MELELAFNLIKTDPRTLLDNAFVSIAGGGSKSYSKLAYFTISKPAARQGRFKRLGSDALIPSFEVAVHEDATSLPPKFKSNIGEDQYSFQAFYIAMKRVVAVGSVPAGTRFVLPSAGESDVCITSQLSGCTFGIGSQGPGGCCLVSHIQPVVSAATDQALMAQQTQSLFGSPPVKLIEKGMGKDYVDRAHVIGHRAYGVWQFYLQKFLGIPTYRIDPVEDI